MGEIIHNDPDYLNMLAENTDEVILILNNFGEIVSYNPALKKALNLNNEDITGKPLREIFETDLKTNEISYKAILLDSLKKVFLGKDTDLLCPIPLKGSSGFRSVYLKFKPKIKNGNIDYVFVNGRFLQSDYISDKWLVDESSKYIIDNDLTHINLFSYRLTRNLESRLEPNMLFYIQIALQEVITNAIEHGNLEISFEKKTELVSKTENYSELVIKEAHPKFLNERKVYLDYSLTREKVVYTVRDEGKGFDWKNTIFKINNFAAGTEFSSSCHGIGLRMIHKVFDSVEYNDAGNEIRLIKYFR